MYLFSSQHLIKLLPTTLVVQVEQSDRCVCVSERFGTLTFELSELWPIYLARLFTLTLPRSNSKVKVIGHSSRSRKENNC